MKISSRLLVNLTMMLFLTFSFSYAAANNADRKKDTPIDNPDSSKLISDSLKAMRERLPIEKVYLHLDRSSYNIGDTIWFKAYLINAINGTPSEISNVLYVELSDDSTNVVERISIRIKNGVGWGQIPIRKVQFQEGNYLIRAYTSWIQNFRLDHMFTQRIYLGTPVKDVWLIKTNTVLTRDNNESKLDIFLKLTHTDRSLTPVVLKDLSVKIYNEDHYFYKETMRTGVDGSLKLSAILKDRIDGQRIRVQLTSIDPDDGYKVIQVPLIINRSQKLDLQFLPEGGKLVAGVPSVIGFKALGEDGRGTAVSGSVLDRAGNIKAKFSSLHNGMGAFYITPVATEKYTVKVDSPIGVSEEYQLPKIEPTGTVIQVSNEETSSDIQVKFFGLNTVANSQRLLLTAMSNGKLYFSASISPEMKELLIPKQNFPTGIIRLTLFQGTIPLNERMAFIDHHDRFDIKITADKKRYKRRDSVKMMIEVKDGEGFPVEGEFSLAVTDDALVSVDSLGDHGIVANILIGSALKGDFGMTHDLFKDGKLKGEIESPGYYIDRKDKFAWQALDYLLLTQGWTDYDWKDVFSREKPIYFKPQNDFNISGKIVNFLNQPVKNSIVIASSQKPAFTITAVTDEMGIFIFKDLLKLDSGSFFFQAARSNGKPMAIGEIKIDRSYSPFVYSRWMRFPIHPWYVNSDTTDLNLAKQINQKLSLNESISTGTLLKEVKVKQKKVIKDSWNPFGPGNADYVFNEDDIKRSGTSNLYDFIKRNIPGISIDVGGQMKDMNTIDIRFFGRYTRTLIDGRPLPIGSTPGIIGRIEELSKYQLASIKGVEFAYSAKTTNGAEIPTLIVTTYKGNGGLKRFDGVSDAYRPFPITAPISFYTPKYKAASSENTEDRRQTIFWEPNIKTDQNGRALISFQTSDASNGVSLNLQGFGNTGGFGGSLYRFGP